MSSTEYDTIVAGVGVVGAATAAHLSRRGQDVLAVDKYDVPNPRGTSAGTSRIFRLAYHEGDTYVPLLREALEQWAALDDTATRPLLRRTGSLTIGEPDAESFIGAKRTCEAHDIDHEILEGTEISTRFPGFDLPSTYRAVYQPDGHLIDAEQGVVALVERALENGCVVRGRTPVTDWHRSGDHVAVETPRGTYEASDLVVTSGAWAANHLPDVGRHLTVERHVACRFQPADPSLYRPGKFPVFVMDTVDGRHFYRRSRPSASGSSENQRFSG